jgi:hypothetical protein
VGDGDVGDAPAGELGHWTRPKGVPDERKVSAGRGLDWPGRRSRAIHGIRSDASGRLGNRAGDRLRRGHQRPVLSPPIFVEC